MLKNVKVKTMLNVKNVYEIYKMIRQKHFICKRYKKIIKMKCFLLILKSPLAYIVVSCNSCKLIFWIKTNIEKQY